MGWACGYSCNCKDGCALDKPRNPKLDSDDTREYVAGILEDIAENGLPGPRDLDVALDAIEQAYFAEFSDQYEVAKNVD